MAMGEIIIKMGCDCFLSMLKGNKPRGWCVFSFFLVGFRGQCLPLFLFLSSDFFLASFFFFYFKYLQGMYARMLIFSVRFDDFFWFRFVPRCV